MIRIIELAEAVVSELIWAFPSGGAVRAYDPTIDLEELAGVRVIVIPRDLATAMATRRGTESEIGIDVAIQGRAADDFHRDEMIRLAENIGQHFHDKTLDVFDESADWIATEHDPIFAPEHLRQYGVLTSIVTLRFRVGP